jgi:hypothetical protein
MAKELYEASAGPKKLFLVNGGRHDNCATIAGAAYQRNVLEFLAALDIPGQPKPKIPNGL